MGKYVDNKSIMIHLKLKQRVANMATLCFVFFILLNWEKIMQNVCLMGKVIKNDGFVEI